MSSNNRESFSDYANNQRGAERETLPSVRDIDSWREFAAWLRTAREKNVIAVGEDSMDAIGYAAAQVRSGELKPENVNVDKEFKRLFARLGSDPNYIPPKGKSESLPEIKDIKMVTTWEELFSYLDYLRALSGSDRLQDLAGLVSLIRAGKIRLEQVPENMFETFPKIKNKIKELQSQAP